MTKQCMRIRDVVAVPLHGVSPPSGWAAETKPGDSLHTLIAVHTDQGITGYGSVYSNGELVLAALRVLEPLYMGENALEPERVAEKLHQNTFWMGRGGTLTHAISGIDIALWDILGKALGQPVGRLLGGTYRSKIMPYCSLIMSEPGQMRDKVSEFRERGFRAFKVGWGPFGRQGDSWSDAAIIRAAREGAGDKAALFVDAGASDAYWRNGLRWAINTAHMLADYGVGWFEEALRPDAMEDFIELRRQSRVPIAGGEVLTRRQSFTPWLVKGAFDIVQPDVTKVGGISEQRRIAWLADEFGIEYVGHGWNTAIGLAADLQLAAALPHVEYVEFIGESGYVNGILGDPLEIDGEGYLDIPERSGLGVTLDLEKIAYISTGSERLRA